ncbi:MAG TPA: amino acid permease, partial [Ruminococcaceae bacterium]|nr:amino acid permease [Oscillospiraceae bacterium]
MSELKKKYGLITAICMVVGIVVGSGVFFKAEAMLNITNGDLPVALISWLIG